MLGKRISQAEFADIVGLSEGTVSLMKTEGVISKDGTGLSWIREYTAHIREIAAGRAGSLDLSHERAALAREQRVGLEIKNAVLRGDYAAVAMLSEVLAIASQAVAERFDHLPGLLRKLCPDMNEADRDQVLAAIASARNDWARATAELVAKMLPDDEDLAEVDGDSAA
ncbi:MAG: hypothetical protein EBU31_00075 [Proteobacteria bacterium]|nr:hypothetical protein [Pseudomonadota bacterium]